MIKRFIKKDGSVIYLSDETKLGYSADKLEILLEFKKQKPIAKASTEELIDLCKRVLDKDVKPSQCKSCSRNKWIVLLQNYMDVAEKLLKVDAPQEPDEEKTPVETYTLQDGTILNVYADNSIEPALEDGTYQVEENKEQNVVIKDGLFSGLEDKPQPTEEKPKKKGGKKK